MEAADPAPTSPVYIVVVALALFIELYFNQGGLGRDVDNVVAILTTVPTISETLGLSTTIDRRTLLIHIKRENRSAPVNWKIRKMPMC